MKPYSEVKPSAGTRGLTDGALAGVSTASSGEPWSPLEGAIKLLRVAAVGAFLEPSASQATMALIGFVGLSNPGQG